MNIAVFTNLIALYRTQTEGGRPVGPLRRGIALKIANRFIRLTEFRQGHLPGRFGFQRQWQGFSKINDETPEGNGKILPTVGPERVRRLCQAQGKEDTPPPPPACIEQLLRKKALVESDSRFLLVCVLVRYTRHAL